MKTLILTILTLTLIFAFTLPTLADTKGDINKMLNQYINSFKAENTNQMAAFFTDPCQVGEESCDAEAVKANLQLFFDDKKVNKFEMNNRVITVIDSNNATVTCTEHTIDTGYGETKTKCKYTLVKTEQGWKISKKEFVDEKEKKDHEEE